MSSSPARSGRGPTGAPGRSSREAGRSNRERLGVGGVRSPVVRSGGSRGFRRWGRSPWCARPGRSSWVTDPLAIDAGFQLMVIWCLEYMGAHSLPTYVATYRQFVPSFPKEGAKVEVHIDAILTNRVLADLSFTDHDGRPLAQITGYECVVDQSLKSAFANNSLQPHPATAAGDD